jgi:hypothetical protein
MREGASKRWLGASRLATVARLEHVIDELAKLELTERGGWLKLAPVVSDYAILINGPWATEQRRKGFDAGDAAARYRRMAEKTKDWGIESLTIQCWIARGVIQNSAPNASTWSPFAVS